MAKMNPKAEDRRLDKENRLAGGFGAPAARQDNEATLRRLVMANMLWEDLAYADGKSVAEEIARLIPEINPATVAMIAVEAREKQKLRHTPLFIAREMARHPEHRAYLSEVLPKVIGRPDGITDFMALYWQDGKEPIAKQVKLGLETAFAKFDAYQYGKHRHRDRAVKLHDVMRLVHPKPPQGKEELYKQVAEDNVPTPDTWETALSGGADKKATWERLISERRLGALAFLRNLRNMEQVSVSSDVIEYGFRSVRPTWLLPTNFVSAAQHAPRWESQIEALMFQCLALVPKLPGRTVFVVDVSGSMHTRISAMSDRTRLDIAGAMAMQAREVCENVTIYATAGSDASRIHQTQLLPARRGFGLSAAINEKAYQLGGGGIFTRQCLEYIREHEQGDFDRIIVFSDSQDCDYYDKRTPAPFGKHNYIVDVSAHRYGINYAGVWTAEVAGHSEHFLPFIAASEGLAVESEESEDTE